MERGEKERPGTHKGSRVVPQSLLRHAPLGKKRTERKHCEAHRLPWLQLLPACRRKHFTTRTDCGDHARAILGGDRHATRCQTPSPIQGLSDCPRLSQLDSDLIHIQQPSSSLTNDSQQMNHLDHRERRRLRERLRLKKVTDSGNRGITSGVWTAAV